MRHRVYRISLALCREPQWPARPLERTQEVRGGCFLFFLSRRRRAQARRGGEPSQSAPSSSASSRQSSRASTPGPRAGGGAARPQLHAAAAKGRDASDKEGAAREAAPTESVSVRAARLAPWKTVPSLPPIPQRGPPANSSPVLVEHDPLSCSLDSALNGNLAAAICNRPGHTPPLVPLQPAPSTAGEAVSISTPIELNIKSIVGMFGVRGRAPHAQLGIPEHGSRGVLRDAIRLPLRPLLFSLAHPLDLQAGERGALRQYRRVSMYDAPTGPVPRWPGLTDLSRRVRPLVRGGGGGERHVGGETTTIRNRQVRAPLPATVQHTRRAEGWVDGKSPLARGTVSSVYGMCCSAGSLQAPHKGLGWLLQAETGAAVSSSSPKRTEQASSGGRWCREWPNSLCRPTFAPLRVSRVSALKAPRRASVT